MVKHCLCFLKNLLQKIRFYIQCVVVHRFTTEVLHRKLISKDDKPHRMPPNTHVTHAKTLHLDELCRLAADKPRSRKPADES